MRIATGGISHESSTRVPSFTTLKDFENGFGLYRGQDLIDRFRGANICTGGFIEGADKHGFELVPLLWGFAYPSGRVRRQDYDLLKAELLERLRAAETEGGPVDGFLLDLHGAMAVEGIDDGDGDVIAAVRVAMGPDRPVMVTQDLHGNHTELRVRDADAVVGFDTYPHVDQRERGLEAADLMVATLRGEVKPTSCLRRLPLLWSASRQVTAHPPMKEVMDRVHSLEQRDGVLTITLATGFPHADVPQLGASIIVVTDNDTDLASATADELANWIWENRERWYQAPLSVREALDAGAAEGKYPIILADEADNTGGGAPGDSTEVLQTFLELGLTDALVLYMADPEAAEQAHAVGAGKVLDAELGGKSHPSQGKPVPGPFEVVAVSDGRFSYDGPMFEGLTGEMGPSAWLRQGGVSIVVVSAREQPLDPGFARTLGIDCSQMRTISVKSSAHFRSGFERIAGSIYNVGAQALHVTDLRKLDVTRPDRPLYPIDPQATLT